MLEKLYDYINDNEFRMTIYDDKIHLINFTRIITLEDNFISIKTPNKKISFSGNHLALNKLLDHEMLISGTLSKVEVFDE